MGTLVGEGLWKWCLVQRPVYLRQDCLVKSLQKIYRRAERFEKSRRKETETTADTEITFCVVVRDGFS